MKELTIEQKAQRYNESLAKAKELYSQHCAEWRDEDIEYIFPELKESRDEKIRKAIIEGLKEMKSSFHTISSIKIDDAIDWLERLGKQKHENICSNCTNRKGCINCEDGILKETLTYKHSDDIEPKFKVGDWITNGRYTRLIVGINSNWPYYMFKDGTSKWIKDIDKKYHLWTIQDAKDGDVLSYVTDEEDLWIMIYWSLYEPYEGHVHYHALLVNDNFSDKGTCCICINDLKPATKEQRDQLKKAMTDAGYTFDFEKKELKKIEQKSAWCPSKK